MTGWGNLDPKPRITGYQRWFTPSRRSTAFAPGAWLDDAFDVETRVSSQKEGAPREPVIYRDREGSVGGSLLGII